MSGRTIIHMNGRDYDASGTNLTPVHHRARTMDGVLVTPSHHATPKHPRVAAPAIIRKPDRAQTLSRTSVHKPASLSGISGHRPSSIVMPRATMDARTLRAGSITHHPEIKKFNFDVKTVPLTPKAAPVIHEAREHKSRSDQLVDKHLLRAHAHTAPAHRKKPIRDKFKYMSTGRRKLMSISASAMAVLLISGFIVYQSLPNISMGIASRRAGFSAMLPNFTPNGYTLRGPVDYAPGKVILTFNSNTSDRNYQIEQTPSGWSSETLKEQVASSSGSQYQTFQMRGLTIFFTNNNSATWVDRGVLFSLNGDSGLSGDQIASIATSM